MPQNHSERIAKAKALAKLFNVPEQEVINLALQEGSGDPSVSNPAEGRLAALGGRPEGSLMSIDAPPTRPDPWADAPRYEGDRRRFNVRDLQAEAIEAQGKPNSVATPFNPFPRRPKAQ